MSESEFDLSGEILQLFEKTFEKEPSKILKVLCENVKDLHGNLMSIDYKFTDMDPTNAPSFVFMNEVKNVLRGLRNASVVSDKIDKWKGSILKLHDKCFEFLKFLPDDRDESLHEELKLALINFFNEEQVAKKIENNRTDNKGNYCGRGQFIEGVTKAEWVESYFKDIDTTKKYLLTSDTAIKHMQSMIEKVNLNDDSWIEAPTPGAVYKVFSRELQSNKLAKFCREVLKITDIKNFIENKNDKGARLLIRKNVIVIK